MQENARKWQILSKSARKSEKTQEASKEGGKCFSLSYFAVKMVK